MPRTALFEELENIHHIAEKLESEPAEDDANEISDIEATKPEGSEGVSDAKSMSMSMSLNTALPIGLHNFPKGLATFVAT